MHPPSWEGTKVKRETHKSRHRKHGKADPRLEQPTADLTGNVPCKICGTPVDSKRMHFHMVRFHGVALRSKAPLPQG